MASKKNSTKQDYEVLPRDEILELKDKIDRYTKSKNPMVEDINDLRSRMDKLTEHIKTINSIFETAQDELELEQKQQDFIERIYDPMVEKVDAVLEQNQIIATALLNIVDMFKDQHMELLKELSEIRKKQSPITNSTRPVTSNMPSSYGSNFSVPLNPELNQSSQFGQQSMSQVNINPASAQMPSQMSNQIQQPQRPSQQMMQNRTNSQSMNQVPSKQPSMPEVKKKGLFSDLFK